MENKFEQLIEFLQAQTTKILYYDPQNTIKKQKGIDFIINSEEELNIKLETYLWDIIIFDIHDEHTFSILEKYKKNHPQTKLVFFALKEDFKTILSAYQIGIDLYLPKYEINIKYFMCAIELLQKDYSRIIISKSPKLQKNYEFLKFYAQKISSDVLITGENGTGKGIVANAVYLLNKYRGGFLVQNCAGIPDTLFESEMFGYEPGTFTGASLKGKIGVIEKADKGVLFLDEVGELPINQQAKLLRAIQRKVILRVGAQKERNIDVRFIFATNKNLYNEVQEGKFREDFFYRIKGAEIEIPPLRETKEDIEIMIAVFTSRFLEEQFNKEYLSNITLNYNSLEELKKYDFPGNIRELQKIVYQSLIKMMIENSNELEINLPSEEKKSSFQNNEQNVDIFWQIIKLLEANLIKYRGLSENLKKPVLDHLRTKYKDNRKNIAKILGFQDKQSLTNEIYRLNLRNK